MNVKVAKVLALLGSLFAGGSSIAAGDAVTGWGIIAAAMSSVSVFSKPQ